MEEEKSKEQLLSELAITRQQLLEAKRRVAELETLEKERKQAQEALRDSQEQLELIIDSIPALIAYVDSNQRFLHANQAHADWYGRSKQELVGKHLRDVLYEESYQGAIDYIKTVLQGQEVSYENISYDTQGQMRAVSVAYVPHFDETGQVKAFLGLVQDITARKQALAALRESEKRYRSVVENSHAGVLIVGDAYRLVYVNDQMCRILGYQRGELVNRDFRELLNDEARDLVADHYVRRQRGEEVPPQYELTIVRKDGERRQVEIHAATIRDSAGAVQTVGQALDITGRKQAEKSIERLAKFPSENPNPVLRVAQDGTVLYANRASRPLLESWKCQIGQPLPVEWRQFVSNAIDAGLSREADVQVEDRQLLLTFAPVAEAGYANIYGLDITERERVKEALRESEERFRRAVLEAPFPIMIHAEGGEVVQINRVWTDLTGYAPSEIPTIVDWTERAYGERKEYVRAVIDRLYRLNKRVQEGEFVITTSSREKRTWEFSSAPLGHLPDGRRLVISIAMDITERKQMEQELRQRAADLEARNEELDAFAHTAAHDLKNPLGTMIGFAEVLEQDAVTMPDDELQRYLRLIARNGRKMNSIIDELLLLSRLRQAEVEMVPLDMTSIVAEAQHRLADLIEEHRAEIIIPIVWPVAQGYAPWVEEVWVNYLGNAIKYGGRPPRVELGAIPPSIPPTGGEVKGGMVRFWVRDNGPGLTQAEQRQLFTPFTRLDQTRARGHGLGLSIVRRIVEKLGGQVGVESEVGQGSVFTFRLPGVPTQDVRNTGAAREQRKA